MPVVVVESPAKAKTINAYLGSDYTVLASYGHVRDLPPKDGSVHTEDDFAMDWEVQADSRKHLKAIADALKLDNALILATDPDREGEAISWHLTEALRDRKSSPASVVSRASYSAPRGVFSLAATVQYSCARNASISISRSTIRRRQTDCTRPADLAPGSLRHSTGDRLKPTR